MLHQSCSEVCSGRSSAPGRSLKRSQPRASQRPYSRTPFLAESFTTADRNRKSSAGATSLDWSSDRGFLISAVICFALEIAVYVFAARSR
jgi:hypothetical protein